MNIVFILWILFMPCIMCAILAAIIIGIINTNIIKNKKFKILIVVVILLGVCIILINLKIFRYNAGNIGKGLYIFNKTILFDSYDSYVLEVSFNEDNRVESTILQYVP